MSEAPSVEIDTDEDFNATAGEFECHFTRLDDDTVEYLVR